MSVLSKFSYRYFKIICALTTLLVWLNTEATGILFARFEILLIGDDCQIQNINFDYPFYIQLDNFLLFPKFFLAVYECNNDFSENVFRMKNIHTWTEILQKVFNTKNKIGLTDLWGRRISLRKSVPIRKWLLDDLG